MSNSKSVKENVDKMEESPMDTDSSDESSSSSNEGASENPPVRPTQLARSNPLLMDLLLPDSNQISPQRHNREIQMPQNLNEGLLPRRHARPALEKSSSKEKSPAKNSQGFLMQHDRYNPFLAAKPNAYNVNKPSTFRNPSEEHARPDSGESSSSSKETSSSRSRQEFLMQYERCDPLLSEKPKACHLNEPSISKNPSEERTHAKPDSGESSSSLKETSPSRNPLEFLAQFDRSNPLLVEKPEACQLNEASVSGNPSEEQTFRDRSNSSQMHERSISDDVPASKNQPELEREINIDVVEQAASTSRHQSLIEGGSAHYRPSSSDVLQCGKLYERLYGTKEPCIPFRADSFPIYASEAQVLLQSVLREIMRYNEENDRWGFALQFFKDSELPSNKYGTDLEKDLMKYLVEMKVDTPRKHGPSMPYELTIETYILGAYEKLTSTVITALTFTLMVRLSRDFDGLFFTYISFRGLFDTFFQYWENNSIENTEDEVCRNRVKTWKKLIQRLLSVTLSAFRLFLMYIGENSDERKVEEYAKYLSDEDKTYLRRNN